MTHLRESCRPGCAPRSLMRMIEAAFCVMWVCFDWCLVCAIVCSLFLALYYLIVLCSFICEMLSCWESGDLKNLGALRQRILYNHGCLLCLKTNVDTYMHSQDKDTFFHMNLSNYYSYYFQRLFSLVFLEVRHLTSWKRKFLVLGLTPCKTTKIQAITNHLLSRNQIDEIKKNLSKNINTKFNWWYKLQTTYQHFCTLLISHGFHRI